MASDFVLRVHDDQQGFEPGMRVEIFQVAGDLPGRLLKKAPFGPYRIIECVRVPVNDAAWVDITLRRLRRR